MYDNSQVQTLLFLGAKFKHRTTLTLHVPGSIYSFAQNSGGNVFRIQQEMQDYVIKKSIIQSLDQSKRPCVSKLYYGKKSCIEEVATQRFLRKTGCILPWMRQIHPNSVLCSDEDKIFKEALQEYTCAMADDTYKLYNTTEYQLYCQAYDSLESECQNIRSS